MNSRKVEGPSTGLERAADKHGCPSTRDSVLESPDELLTPLLVIEGSPDR
eukprot:CAMPEP_0171544384 /NCGR_PEP_ID=MMETSP0960-20121227/3471_1 /TAXON_ID=87120 /ORGANISM="Aurantiochytrium limacinum, Strain ATCCMYA-1381" /LENGTH=49 /DNA_ID=CAMNT_0012092187 /DNA_START=422 /DNA_END=571 /DNA_ORIENTATION=+